jgi:hypothetical protein
MSYIPSKDADLISWGENYSDLLTADPALYGLTAGDALTVQTQFDEFQAAYNLAVNPSTRTIVTVAAKDEEKAGFLSIARAYAAIIRANQAVSPSDKAALGLSIPDPTPTPVPPPSSVPVLAVPLVGPNQHYMTIADQFTPTSKAKPVGVAGMLLYRVVGTAPAVDPEQADVIGLFTRADQLISTAGVVAGKIVTYWGRWYNRKGQIGDFSSPVSAVSMT